MQEAEIRAKLNSSEDCLIERKTTLHQSSYKKTIVAFANTLDEGEEAIFFVGIEDNGKIVGVSNSDKTQKDAYKYAQDCYPPITVTSYVIKEKSKDVVAIIVRYSNEKPHFEGGSYIRRGSQNIKASEEMLNMLIDMRSDIVRKILRYKEKHPYVEVHVPVSGDKSRASKQKFDCSIKECNQDYVILNKISNTQELTFSVKDIKISFNNLAKRPILIVS